MSSELGGKGGKLEGISLQCSHVSALFESVGLLTYTSLPINVAFQAIVASHTIGLDL